MLPVNESEVFSRMHQHVQAYNACQTYLADTIRLGTLRTLDTLVNTACKQLRQHLKSVFAISADELPPVYTNRKELADLSKCGARTVYDHLKRLEEVGLVRKVFRGRTHDFKVWISPWILLGAAFEQPPLTDLETARRAGFTPPMRQISPPKSTSEGNNNSTKSGVDTVENAANVGQADFPPCPRVRVNVRLSTSDREVAPLAFGARESALDGSPGGGAAGLDTGVDMDKSGLDWLEKAQLAAQSGASNDTGGKPAGSLERLGNATATGGSPQPAGRPTPAPDSGDFRTHKIQDSLVQAFWELAREKFWPNQNFSADHTQKILNLLRADVFDSWQGCPTDQKTTDRYRRRYTQLEKAEKYINKMRWSSLMPPLTYFSLAHYQKQVLEGTKGNFHHTTKWQLSDERKAGVVKSNLLIDRAIDSVIHGRAPRNARVEPTRLALYTYWKNRLHREVGDGLLTDRFHASVSAAVGKLAVPVAPLAPQ